MAKQGTFLAVEISERYLKLAHLKVSSNKREVLGLSISEIAGFFDDDIAGKIQQFVRDQRIKKAEVVNIIPSNFAVFKNIEIPSVDPKEIKEIIDLQAGRHTPYSREEIIMDYSNIGVVHDRYTKILLIIVKKDVVTQRYNIIKKSGFKAETAVLSAETVSGFCFDSCPEKTRNTPVGIVHIDNIHVDLTIVSGGKSIYIRSFPFAAGADATVSSDMQKKLLEEIKTSLESYQAENIDALPSVLYLVGVTDSIKAIIAEIQKAAGVNVEILSVFDLFSMSPGVSDVYSASKHISALSVLAPAAFLDGPYLNLIPEDVRMQKDIKRRARDITKMGIFSMASLILLCVALFMDMFFKGMYFEELLSSYTSETEEAQRITQISQRSGMMKKFLNRKGRVLFVLTEIFKAMPEQVYLNSISFKEGKIITLTGTADIMSRVFSLVTDLENEKLFKNVKVDFTKTRRFKNQEVSDFGLTFELERVF